MDRATYAFALAAAAAPIVSIAAANILLGITLLLFIVNRVRPRFPRFALALGVFLLGTMISLAASSAPRDGLPQVKKLYVFCLLPVVYTMFSRAGWRRRHRVAEESAAVPTETEKPESIARHADEDVLRLTGLWCTLGGISAGIGVWQFWHKWWTVRAEGGDFYSQYIGRRITGTMSHWMTFSGLMMMAVLLGAAVLLFRPMEWKKKLLLGTSVALMSSGLLFAETRSAWIATAVAAVYLLYAWRKRAVLLVPAALVLLMVAGPPGVKSRIISLVQPHGERDSNSHRVITWKTGVRMIEAHPWLGLGPEEVGKQFMSYLPPGTPLPLPEGWYGHLHNIYLQFAAERGIPTLCALLWMFAWILRDWFRALRDQRVPRWVLHGGIACVVAILVAGLGEHNLGDSEVLMMTLSVLGAVEACRHVAQHS